MIENNNNNYFPSVFPLSKMKAKEFQINNFSWHSFLSLFDKIIN